MKKTLLLILCLSLTTSLFSQNFRFAVVSDLYAGKPGTDELIKKIIQDINSAGELDFVVFAGNLTFKSKREEFENAQRFIQELNVPFYVIPGQGDIKNHPYGLGLFREVFGDERFYFEKDSISFIGINTSMIYGGNGFAGPEEIEFLKKSLTENKPKNIVLFSYYPLEPESIYNADVITNQISGSGLKYNLHITPNNEKLKTNYTRIQIPVSVDTAESEANFSVYEMSPRGLSEFEAVTGNRLEMKNNFPLPDNSLIKLNQIAETTLKGTSKLRFRVNTTTISEPVYYEDKIYHVSRDGILTCFDSTGAIMWEFDAYDLTYGSPAVKDGFLAVSNVFGDLYTINPETGVNLQSIGFDEYITSKLKIIEYTGDKELMIPKESGSNAAVVLGTESGQVYCFDLETLEQIWVNKDAKGAVESDFLYVNDKLIYGSRDGSIYCIDTKKGWLIWKYRINKDYFKSPARVAPVTNGRRVYAATPDETLHAFDLLLGNAYWQRENKYQANNSLSVSKDGRLVFVKGNEDKFHIVDAKNGNWMQVINIKYGVDMLPGNPQDIKDGVLFNCADGNIYKVNDNYKYETILKDMQAPVISIKEIKPKLFMAAAMDGEIIIFSLN